MFLDFSFFRIFYGLFASDVFVLSLLSELSSLWFLVLQWQTWASSHDMGHNLECSLVGQPMFPSIPCRQGRKFCVWVGVPFPPLKAFPGYKKWSIPAPYPPLQGVMARVAQIDSRGFHCTRLLPYQQNAPQFQPSLPVLSPSPVPLDPYCSLPLLPIIHSKSWYTFLSQGDQCFPPFELFLLHSLWVCGL